MNAEYFRQLLHRQPFEPFSVHLSNGEILPVRHPECATLTNTRLVVVEPEQDRITVVSLLHVAGVEMLPAKAS